MSHIHIDVMYTENMYRYITHSLFYFKCKSRPCVVRFFRFHQLNRHEYIFFHPKFNIYYFKNGNQLIFIFSETTFCC